MTFRSLSPTAVGLVLIALSATACDEIDDRNFIGPRGLSAPSAAVSTLVIPSTLPFQILPVLGCPFASPFASNFSVIVEPAGVDLVLAEVGFQFLDGDGFVSPLTFSQSDLNLLFGSTVVSAGIRRTFAFQSHFGCGLRSAPRRMTGRFRFGDWNGGTLERGVEAQFANR